MPEIHRSPASHAADSADDGWRPNSTRCDMLPPLASSPPARPRRGRQVAFLQRVAGDRPSSRSPSGVKKRSTSAPVTSARHFGDQAWRAVLVDDLRHGSPPPDRVGPGSRAAQETRYSWFSTAFSVPSFQARRREASVEGGRRLGVQGLCASLAAGSPARAVGDCRGRRSMFASTHACDLDRPLCAKAGTRPVTARPATTAAPTPSCSTRFRPITSPDRPPRPNGPRGGGVAEGPDCPDRRAQP